MVHESHIEGVCRELQNWSRMFRYYRIIICHETDVLVCQNSANIIVQNRMTGHLEEEKMQVYVRLGIRLLYKGAKGRLEGARG